MARLPAPSDPRFFETTLEGEEKMANSDGVLHPRPRVTRAQWIDLNGTWQFAYDAANAGIVQHWQDDAARFDKQIVVPFPPESEMSGIGDTSFHAVLWYRRTFSANAPAGQRLLLHFGAVDYRAKVWVNGSLVAEHEGGHTPFSADITANLVASGEQVVGVRAEDQPTDITQPRGKQDWEPKPHAIWYNRTSGIWQAVWLEPVPDTYVADLRLTPKDAILAEQSVRVLGNIVDTRVAIPAAQNGVHRGDLYWTPDNPNLIDVTVTVLGSDAKPVDAVESYFGLRSVGILNGRFVLNDRPVFVRSVLEQGYWPKSHLAAPSPEALKREVELIKTLGFNAVRIHQKIEDPRFLYWADHRGQPVMLTEFGGLSMHPKTGEAWFGYATAQSDDEYLEMIKQLFDGIYESTELAGFCYTQITDTLQETNGLYDENRQPKLPVDRLRDIIMRPSNAVPSESLDVARQKALRISCVQVV